MKRKRTLLWLGVAALCALIVGATASAQRSATAKVALVTDIGGLNDKGFNHLSYVGLQRAQKQLTAAGGVNGRVFITNSANDRKPNLQTAAQTGNGLVIARRLAEEFLDSDRVLGRLLAAGRDRDDDDGRDAQRDAVSTPRGRRGQRGSS